MLPDVIWCKSIAAGVLAVVVFVVVGSFVFPWVLSRKAGVPVGWDIIQISRLPTTWLLLAFAFSLGFAFEYLRLSR